MAHFFKNMECVMQTDVSVNRDFEAQNVEKIKISTLRVKTDIISNSPDRSVVNYWLYEDVSENGSGDYLPIALVERTTSNITGKISDRHKQGIAVTMAHVTRFGSGEINPSTHSLEKFSREHIDMFRIDRSQLELPKPAIVAVLEFVSGLMARTR